MVTHGLAGGFRVAVANGVDDALALTAVMVWRWGLKLRRLRVPQTGLAARRDQQGTDVDQDAVVRGRGEAVVQSGVPALELLGGSGVLVRTGVRVPRMNTVIERWIGTIRNESLDRKLV